MYIHSPIFLGRMQHFIQAAVPHATNSSQFCVHFVCSKYMVVLCITQSSCPLQGENQGPFELAFVTSMQVHCSTHWPLKINIPQMTADAWKQWHPNETVKGFTNNLIYCAVSIQCYQNKNGYDVKIYSAAFSPQIIDLIQLLINFNVPEVIFMIFCKHLATMITTDPFVRKEHSTHIFYQFQ